MNLKKSLARRDAILDRMLGLSDYAPMTLKRRALNQFMLDGHQEQSMPIELRRAQAEVLRLLDV